MACARSAKREPGSSELGASTQADICSSGGKTSLRRREVPESTGPEFLVAQTHTVMEGVPLYNISTDNMLFVILLLVCLQWKELVVCVLTCFLDVFASELPIAIPSLIDGEEGGKARAEHIVVILIMIVSMCILVRT